jgi:3-oxoacyl-[acyl-carrier protein] reductase
VAVNYLGDGLALAREVVGEIEARGGRAFPIPANVANTKQLRSMFDATLETYQRLDIVVNNAAWAFNKAIAEVTEEEFDRIFAVNCEGDVPWLPGSRSSDC